MFAKPTARGAADHGHAIDKPTDALSYAEADNRRDCDNYDNDSLVCVAGEARDEVNGDYQGATVAAKRRARALSRECSPCVFSAQPCNSCEVGRLYSG
jgi:hypothetical protein